MGTCELPKILDLLPDGFQSDDMIVGASEILHQLISSFEKDKSLETIVPDEIKNVLLEQSYSNKGVMNWFNYYQPYLGSDKFIEYLLKLSNVNTTILPWYQTDNPTNTFDLILDSYPGSINLEHLLTLINTYKNIEAKLASVRMADCPIRFTLDNSSLDYDILSDTAGYSINGTTFCFRNISKQDPIQISQTEFAMLRTKTTSLRLAYPHHETLDNTILGDKNIILEPSTQRMIVKSEPVAPIIYNLGEAYNWRTFKAQQVLSDYGSLSGGEGFIGTFKHAAENTLGTMVLSNELPTIEKIIEFYWQHYTNKVDATDLFDNTVFRNFRTKIGTYGVHDPASVKAYQIRGIAHFDHIKLKKQWMGNWKGLWDSSYEPALRQMITKSFIQYKNIDPDYDVEAIRTIPSRNIIEALPLDVKLGLATLTTKIRTEYGTLRRDWVTSATWSNGDWTKYVTGAKETHDSYRAIDVDFTTFMNTTSKDVFDSTNSFVSEVSKFTEMYKYIPSEMNLVDLVTKIHSGVTRIKKPWGINPTWNTAGDWYNYQPSAKGFSSRWADTDEFISDIFKGLHYNSYVTDISSFNSGISTDVSISKVIGSHQVHNEPINGYQFRIKTNSIMLGLNSNWSQKRDWTKGAWGGYVVGSDTQHISEAI